MKNQTKHTETKTTNTHTHTHTHTLSASFAGRHVVGFLYLFIDVFLGVENKRYS